MVNSHVYIATVRFVEDIHPVHEHPVHERVHVVSKEYSVGLQGRIKFFPSLCPAFGWNFRASRPILLSIHTHIDSPIFISIESKQKF